MKTHHTSSRSAQRGGAVAKILIGLVLLGVVLVVGGVLLLPKITASAIEKRTGFALTSDSLSVNPLGGAFNSENMRLTNPHTFPSPDFITFRTLRSDVDLGSLFSDRIVINEAVVDLETLALIRAIDGTVNAKLFAERLRGDAAPSEPTTEPKAAKDFLIKKLEIRVSKIRVENHTGQKPSVREFDANISQSYENVTDLKQLATVPVLLKLEGLESVLKDIAPAAIESLLQSKGKSAGDVLNMLKKQGKDALKPRTDTLEETRKP